MMEFAFNLSVVIGSLVILSILLIVVIKIVTFIIEIFKSLRKIKDIEFATENIYKRLNRLEKFKSETESFYIGIPPFGHHKSIEKIKIERALDMAEENNRKWFELMAEVEKIKNRRNR